MTIQYVVDKNGKKTSVLISLKKWKAILSRQTLLENKLRVFSGIREALKEIKEAEKSGKKLKKLSDFINENRS